MTPICSIIIRGDRACVVVPSDTNTHQRCLVRLVGVLAERAFPDIHEPLRPDELEGGPQRHDAVLSFVVDPADDLTVQSNENVRGLAMAKFLGEVFGLEVRE